MAYVFQFFVICITAINLNSVQARKILLQELRTVTLRHGEMTTSRRSSPVPQLKCVGGTAGCYAFVPQHVQCYNQGSDGYDVQWECKTDMENKYRFGKIDITCEGYEYADDPYILAGSCGLEYAIDLTGSGGGSYSSGHNSYSGSKYGHNTEQTSFGSVFGFICVIMIIFFVYRTCYANPGGDGSSYPNMSSGQFGASAPPPPYSSTPPNDAPPPYGFRPEYQQQQQPKQYPTTGQQQDNGQPGFFSGMLAGGLMGYLFGNNRSGGYGRSDYYSHGYQRDWFGSPVADGAFGGRSFGGSGGSFGGGGASSGSRTSSGFGGTKRR